MRIIERNTKNYRVATLTGMALLLASCGGGNSSSIVNTPVIPGATDPESSRINFDAGTGDIPLPSDLLFSGTTDGTLEPPDEVAGRAAGSIDYGNPAVALGGADGWSTMVPMQVGLTMAEGSTIDATTVGAATVIMIEAVTPPLDGTGAGCIPVEPFVSLSPGQPCGVAAPLTYGVDYVAVAGTDNIVIAPLKPLKAKTTYVLAILDGVMDSRGEAVLGSTQYEQVTRGDIDIDFPPLDSLQDAVNLYEVIIDIGTGGAGSAPADALFASAWTTASVGDAIATATTVMAAAPPSITAVASSLVTVEQAFIGLGLLPAAALGTTALQFADLYSGSVTLPYYSGHPDDGSDPITDNWRARCDNPLVIAGATAAGLLPAPIEPNNTICQTINPALGDYGLDTERHLTKYNPVPAARTAAVLEVQITVPNSASGVAGPWPVVIMQHGITADKEGMLATTGALSAAGFATFAIDHPLHGSRALVSTSAADGDANAGTDATDYMNLANLLVGRDNLNQSMADLLGLRMAIGNSIAGDLASANFDTANVHFFGMSLGGISGTGFTTLANSLGLGLDIQSVALNVPGGGIVPLLIESGGFGSLVQGSVLAGSGTDLGNTFIAFIGSNTPCAGALGCSFDDFVGTLDATSLSIISRLVGQFAFAAQTIIDPADPNNFAAGLAALGTPIYMAEVVGDGINNLSDQTIPNQTLTPGFTFGGTEPLAAFLGLPGVDTDNMPQASGIVRFTDGSHSSLLSPATSLGVTTEMQTQAATFFAAGVVTITDATDVFLDVP
jgi:Pla-1/cef family extracellular lipase